MNSGIPLFPGHIRKNDALFMYGAMQPLPFILAYAQSETEVVHGPSCRKAEEVHLDICERDRVPVQERRGGGGTVVLAPGTVVIIVVGERQSESALDIFASIHTALTGVLSRCGCPSPERSGISDLSIGGMKVLGSSLYMGTRPRLFYYQSSLMVDTDIDLLERYLKHPPREPDYRKGRSHAQFCTTLKQQGCTWSTEMVADTIQRELAGR